MLQTDQLLANFGDMVDKDYKYKEHYLPGFYSYEVGQSLEDQLIANKWL